jgi:hypothetical protein
MLSRRSAVNTIPANWQRAMAASTWSKVPLGPPGMDLNIKVRTYSG